MVRETVLVVNAGGYHSTVRRDSCYRFPGAERPGTMRTEQILRSGHVTMSYHIA